MTRRRASRSAAWASTACLAAAVLTGCAGGADTTRRALSDVPGRELQPPWWTAIPVVQPASEAVDIPADALFATGSAEVRPGDRPRLEAFALELAERIDEAPGTWSIVGATDTTGDDNVALGQARADAVASILATSAAIERGRLRTASWGESCLAVDEATAPDLAQARAQNRRVVFLPPDATPACPLPPP